MVKHLGALLANLATTETGTCRKIRALSALQGSSKMRLQLLRANRAQPALFPSSQVKRIANPANPVPKVATLSQHALLMDRLTRCARRALRGNTRARPTTTPARPAPRATSVPRARRRRWSAARRLSTAPQMLASRSRSREAASQHLWL